MNIKKRDSTVILNTLSGGVVPSRGLEHIMVGRTEEANQILTDLKNVKAGSSTIKFFIGPFGSGKSFIQALTQQIAFKEKFVVAKADFAPNRQLYGSDGKAVGVYTELMKNLSTSTSPEGNALPVILEKWLNDVQNLVVEKKQYGSVEFNNPEFVKDVEQEITSIVSKMDELTGGYDISRVLSLYYKGYAEDNTELQRCVLRWLRGEYKTKTEARQDLGVREIINDANYYDYIKLICKFVREIGYSGLVINLDEAINLYKITHSLTREKNYETILKIYNDALQGNLDGLYVTFGGTPEFLTDERRGLYSYGALKRRLQTNAFETMEYRDLTQPVINLTPLTMEQIFVLLQKLRDIHAAHYEYVANVKDLEINDFMKSEYSRPGAAENLTVGDVIRKFIQALSILHQNPSFDRSQIFSSSNENNESAPTETIMSRFQRTN
ncbi:ATP-binding protein [Paenibacillus profundus]|uniref:ATP-binding protein n=1 Tax=Paenibacillus profundus TaxID=1173085 RepID=A0ABS8YMR8_9BACL|nr:ATP-binding protein [Paenibacillus profundus]MCE5172557.1 ATP-binding protein [Paenibacillus profundus]